MPGFRPDSVRVHPDVEVTWATLSSAAKAGRKPESAVWKALQTCVARVKLDAQWGEVIPRSKIPPYFKRRYGVVNLYCVDLSGFQRGFYTIEGRDVIFLDVVDHSVYDRWFPNKGR